MHSLDARAAGETEQRLYALDAWRETPFYTERERAALAWIEAVTRVSETHVPDSVFEEVKTQFSDQEIVDLTSSHPPSTRGIAWQSPRGLYPAVQTGKVKRIGPSALSPRRHEGHGDREDRIYSRSGTGIS